ncbi:hypothetical protein ACWDO7_22780 [Streptomyces sp. NPDC003656]
MLTLAAAPTLKGTWLGTVTLSGIAACMMLALVLGVRGSDRIKINTKEKVAGWALLTGSVCLAAGGNWHDAITGIGSIPQTAVAQGGVSDWGDAGYAIFLTLCAFGPKWHKLRWPALFALTASPYWVQAGGVGAVILNSARMSLGHLGAGA